MKEVVTEILLQRDRIAKRVREMGEEISRDFRSRDPVLMIGLLKGSLLFVADLIRNISIDVEVDFISISSYRGRSTTSGSVRLLRDLDRDVYDREIIIAEDIIDSGRSLAYIRGALLARNPRGVSIAALLDKRDRRTTEVPLEYVGFVIPDRFVVGYGLDYLERYRGLPDIAVLDSPEIDRAEGGAARSGEADP